MQQIQGGMWIGKGLVVVRNDEENVCGYLPPQRTTRPSAASSRRNTEADVTINVTDEIMHVSRVA